MELFGRLLTYALGAIAALMLTLGAANAQDATPVAQPLPAGYLLQGLRYEAQQWNNCGPATLTSALSFFGYSDDQTRAAEWLKPDREDKNVSPWQMAEFVNTQLPDYPVFAMVRYGGTLERLKTLVSNDFPVIIEAGYDPEPDRLGWMGHYLFVKG
ncbi:MAG: C39 family peptidase, partial [Armatimonadetes bacterium]|nr:C39 family peptidase [Anaerolineae bacterium]